MFVPQMGQPIQDEASNKAKKVPTFYMVIYSLINGKKDLGWSAVSTSDHVSLLSDWELVDMSCGL